MTETPRFIDFGDSAVLIQYSLPKTAKFFSKAVNQNIHRLANDLRQSQNWLEIVPGYDSLLCVFDLDKTSMEDAKKDLKSHLKSISTDHTSKENIIEIPVVYGGDYGPDLDAIKTSSKLSEDAVINLHSQTLYDVCMMGFIPGFTFLSEAPVELHHPRHTTPRQSVPAGSVGIAGWQSGIYGLESPGGWQIIGRTPLKIFDQSRTAPFLIQAGDKIRFVPIGPQDFDGYST